MTRLRVLVAVFLLVGVVVLAPFLAVSSSAFATSYTFTTIDVGGQTQAQGINDGGQITGYFSGHGFLRGTDGAITTFDVPSSFSTFAFGINNAGQIVGQAQLATTPSIVGFLRATNGTYTTFLVPGSSTTTAHGINTTGQIVGYFNDAGAHGFLESGGVFTTFVVPGENFGNTAARGINDPGQIVGTFNDLTLAPLPWPVGNTPRGFLFSGGVFTTIDVPGASESFAYGINAAGQIVGTFVDATGAHGFLRNTGGVFTTIDVPGATHSEAWGINATGQIVGWFNDSTGTHGYLATPVNASPVCIAALAFPAVLGSPNHQFVPIVVMGVTDPDGDAVTITVTGVTQDEPVNAKGDGNTSPDAVIEAGAALVRAERSGKGDGRVYEVSFKADDGKGGSCTGKVTVGVPHSLGKGLTAIDDGQLYDSTVP